MNSSGKETSEPAGRGRVTRRGFGWSVSATAILAVVLLILFRPGLGKAKPGVRPGAGAVPTVAVARVDREDLFKAVTVPAEFRPYTEVELHAKVSGYLQRIAVDFGDRVKAGQLLATLEVPELRDELNNALATERKAEADYADAHLVYSRLLTVNREHPNLVAQQDLDTAQAKDSTTSAAVAAAKADVEKYQTLLAYTRITAPFDGVITRRYADPGTLIQAGTSSDTQSMPLVRLSDNYRLRLDFPVTVEYVKDIRLGEPVEVRVESLGGKSFSGKIARYTGRVNEATRTMTAEIEVDNPRLDLMPGMYASVILRVEQRPGALAIPTEAISAGSRGKVFVVNARHEIESRSITLGLETPTRYEVVAGLRENDLVVIGNAGGCWTDTNACCRARCGGRWRRCWASPGSSCSAWRFTR
jgi:RND family efflux transporter MFP subunit